MKNITIISICVAMALSLLFAFNLKQNAKHYLEDNKLRKEIMIDIVKSQPYMDEMMEEMLKNDSCKQIISHHMMQNADIMSIITNK